MFRTILSTIWERLTEPSRPEEVLTGTALAVYRQGFDVGMADYEFGGPEAGQTNPHQPGTRFHKIWSMGYRRGRDFAMVII